MKKLSIIVLLMGMVINGANAQLLKVDQAVYGMDCAPCAYGLEKGFKKMEGIEAVKVSLNDGIAYLTLAPENGLTLRKIQETVKSNGFSSRSAKVVLKGVLKQNENGWAISMNDETFLLNPDTENKILSALKPGPVKLKGLVMDQEDNRPASQWKIRISEIIL